MVWWRIAKGSVYDAWPEAFEKTVTRGDKVQGAAWRRDSPHFYVAIATTLPASVADEKATLQKFQQKFNKKMGPIGMALPYCPKFEYEKIYQPGRCNFWQYFTQCGFDVLRPTPPSPAPTAIVPVPSRERDEEINPVNHYTVLGVDPGASVEDIKKAGRTLMLHYHPDKRRGNTERFTAVYDALQGTRRARDRGCTEALGQTRFRVELQGARR